MSNYVVLARFDETKDQQFADLRKRLMEEGFAVPEWPPHITIAAYENIEEEPLRKWCAEFASMHGRLKIGLHSLSILPPGGEHTQTCVLCLAPAHAKPLVDFYYDFHGRHEQYCTGIGWYNSIVHGNPIIHATIGIFKIHEMQRAVELVFSQNVFGETEISAIEMYTYPMRKISRFELK